jgi:pullulanase/glycogen debranching enzyme
MTTTRQRESPQYVAESSERTDIRAGAPLPLGTQEVGGGVNIALFSRHASRVRLELFEYPEDAKPARIIDLDSARHRTGDIWHVWVQGIGPDQRYATGDAARVDDLQAYRLQRRSSAILLRRRCRLCSARGMTL